MKKILGLLFFLLCSLCLTGHHAALGAPLSSHITPQKIDEEHFFSSSLAVNKPIFYHRRVQIIPEPIIDEETIAMTQKFFLRLSYVVEKYNLYTLLVLTNILLVLTITRRKQMEKLKQTSPC